MDKEPIKAYQTLEKNNLLIIEDKDITPSLQMEDIIVSDTFSVVYEFIFLNKPVITLDSHSENIEWSNHLQVEEIIPAIEENLKDDNFAQNRQTIIEKYHPYSDGKSAQRIIKATK